MYGLSPGARPCVPCAGGRAARPAGGLQAWAGRVGSGGRPRRHAGVGPVAVAGRCGRTGRRPAVALRAPLHGVGGRAGGRRAAQAWPWGARVQGRRRARCGLHCGPRDQRQAGSVAWGPRPGPGAWVAAGGRGGGGAMRVRGPLAAAGQRGRTGRWSAAGLRAPLHGVGGRAGGTRAAQARLRGGVCKGVGAPDEGPSVGCGASGKGAAWGRAGARHGAAQGRSSVGPRRGVAAWDRAGA